MRKAVIITSIVLLLGIGAFVVIKKLNKPAPVVVPVVVVIPSGAKEIIGTSVEGRPIESYTYGNGAKNILFVGGMHGGYEWNSIDLAQKAMDYLKANPDAIPKDLTITIVPNLNPDGIEKTAEGRFNAHGVDLNRNFDCKWKPESMWQGKKVSAGTASFSEPEAIALKNLVTKITPEAAIFWHSASGAVYASECKSGIIPETLTIMDTYAKAAGYSSVKKFDAYEITGDSEGWLASIGVPAITVELKTHESIEWDKNLAGIKALFAYFSRI